VNVPAHSGSDRPFDGSKPECWKGSDYRHCGCDNKCWVCKKDIIEDNDCFAVVAPNFRTNTGTGQFSTDVVVHGRCEALLKEKYGEPRECLACPLASSHGEVGVYGLVRDLDVCPACEVKIGYNWVECGRCKQQYLRNVAERDYNDEEYCDTCTAGVSAEV
jgi:hypothetical protein